MGIFGENGRNPVFQDERLFRAFFDRYYLVVYRRLYWLLGNQSIAEELCQDIFVSLWQRRLSLPPVDNWEAYLLKSATFKAIDYKRKGTGILSFTDKIEDNAEPVGDEAGDESTDLSEALQREIAALPDRCQIIFKLSRYEQMSYAEIAKTLEISPKTVENQIGKALKILRKNLLPQLFFGLLQIFH